MVGLSAVLAALLLAGCAAPSTAPRATTAAGWKPDMLRRPALFLRVMVGPDFGEREQRTLPEAYEGALLEAFNERAILPRDVRIVTGRLEPQAALARAREVGADHAVLIGLSLQRGEALFCRQTRRPFRAPATLWTQEVEVLRAGDGGTALSIPPGEALALLDLDPDCENPRESRRRSQEEMLGESAARLLGRLLGR